MRRLEGRIIQINATYTDAGSRVVFDYRGPANIITAGILIQTTNVKDLDGVWSQFDSIQIRPKAIHTNARGDYFYKEKGRNVYLDEDQVERLRAYVDRFAYSLKPLRNYSKQ